MIHTLCHLYAYTIAHTWAGLGLWMISKHNLITNGTTTLAVTPGCLSLRAIFITTFAGTICALLTRRWWLAPAACALGLLFSWLRVFTLVALHFTHPNLFHALHARCGFISVTCSLTLLFLILIQYQPRRLRRPPATHP